MDNGNKGENNNGIKKMKVEGGRWKVEGGRWKVEGGRRKDKDEGGRIKMKEYIVN